MRYFYCDIVPHAVASLAILLLVPLATRADGPSRDDLSVEMGRLLLAEIDSFQMRLSPNVPSDKPYYSLSLSVMEVEPNGNSVFNSYIQIDKRQATKIVEHLSSVGLLAVETPNTASAAAPGYVLAIRTRKSAMNISLGWNLITLQHLDSLRTVLEGEAAAGMDRLLGRMTGHRRAWLEAAQGKE